ncbi:CHASE2 domain-containing protein [Marinobacter lutaoensis]|uniref:CHASE2 domain-containing protein n=1 Tax=Marinobacter lutaoensis TaxID=135739 RepID=UPI001594C9A1|nr:CHASE2 domain-containing protein [Marinobacter lutaoensis]NVD35790.1 CHASE2 domain-containing protein [Marinobacter lutaoensis]
MKRDFPIIRTTPWSLGLVLLVLLLLVQTSTLPDRLDNWLFDAYLVNHPATPANDVVVVAIDEISLGHLGRWPWPRSIHAQLIDKLQAAGARTIVFDVLFPEPSPQDPILAGAMARHGNVVLPVHLAEPGPRQLLTEQLPAPQLLAQAARLGHAHVELDADGVARGIYLFNGLGDTQWPSLALAARGERPRHPSRDGLAPYTNVREQYRAVPLAGGAGSLPTVSYVQVLNQPPMPEWFQGKTVFVGATAAGFGDVLPTPFSGLRRPMSGVEFHANAYSALSQDRLIRPAPPWAPPLLYAACLAVLSLLLPRIRPSLAFPLCLGVGGLALALYLAALVLFQLWLPVANALLIPLFALPVSSGLRLAQTNRFLNRQLDELARTPQVTLPSPAHRHPWQLLEQIQALVPLTGWLLTDDTGVVSARVLGPADIEGLPLSPGRWLHQDNRSFIRLTRGHKTYTLGLILPDDLSREAVQQYLRRLRLEERQDPSLGSDTRENISARIERLKAATQRMERMQQFIRLSFERMPDGIIVTDELGVIRFANGHIEEWFHEPMPSLTGLPLARLLEGHDPRETPPWHETVSDTLTLHQSRTVDLRIRDKDFLIHFAPFRLPDTEQHGIIANISDISELREQQRQHREAIDFISHDVRSPLVSQLALIEQLKRDPANIEPDQLEQLGRLARRSYHLAEEFVQLARAEQLTETRFYECEFLAIVENARDSVSEQAIEKNIQLKLHGLEDLWLRGNPELLERAVINLLTNAVQYSPEGTTVNIQVYRAGHLACLTVSDEGMGIDPEELPYLFDRYQRQKRSELAGIHGTGLGLSFVKTVTEKHRGEISVTSVPGQGTSFTMKLPVADPMA